MSSLEAPDPTKIAEREDIDPDNPDALMSLSTELRTEASKAASKAEEFEARRSYAEDPGGDLSQEELKSHWSYHHDRAGRLRREAKVLQKRADKLR